MSSASNDTTPTGRSTVVPRPHGDGLLRWWDTVGAPKATVVICHGYA